VDDRRGRPGAPLAQVAGQGVAPSALHDAVVLAARLVGTRPGSRRATTSPAGWRSASAACPAGRSARSSTSR
jgi:hypothetical protein